MNLFEGIPARLSDELVETLYSAGELRIERIVSAAHASPAEFWYDQDQNEWVIVLQGAARIQFEEEMVEMRSGDYLHIPAHRRHRVDWTSPDEQTIWLAVFYG